MRTTLHPRTKPLGLCLIAWLVGAMTAPVAVHAQGNDEPVSPGQALYDQGRELYGDRDYAGALNLLLQAIQADPTDPRYYVGAARAANFAEELDVSVRLYDMYLEHFGQHAEEAHRRSDRTAAIQRERDQANGRRPTPDVAVTTPADQLAARARFEERLATGPMSSPDATGALSLYRILLRTGYVSPELADLRQQLSDGLYVEATTFFNPTDDSPVPVHTLEEWRALPRRYEAIESLGRPILEDPAVRARLTAAEGQVQLLNRNYDVAVERFRAANQLDPSLPLARLGLLLAWHEQVQQRGCCMAAAAAAEELGHLHHILPVATSYSDKLPHLLYGMVAADTGDATAAAAHLLSLLAPGSPAAAPQPPTPPRPALPPAVPLDPDGQPLAPAPSP